MRCKIGEGDLIGTYQAVVRLNSSEQTSVLLAKDVKHSDRLVVVKLSYLTQLIDTESRFLSDVSHPNIPKLIETGYIELESKKIKFLVTSYNGRLDLIDYLATLESASKLQSVLTLLNEVSNILDFMHSKGFLHCDVKPSNIVVDENGNVTLIDFDAVRTGHSENPIRLTNGYYPDNLKYESEVILKQALNSSIDDYALLKTSSEVLRDLNIEIQRPAELLELVKNEKKHYKSLIACLERNSVEESETAVGAKYISYFILVIVIIAILMSYESYKNPTLEVRQERMKVNSEISTNSTPHKIQIDDLKEELNKGDYDYVSKVCKNHSSDSNGKVNQEIVYLWLASELRRLFTGQTKIDPTPSFMITQLGEAAPAHVRFDAFILHQMHDQVKIEADLPLTDSVVKSKVDSIINDYPNLRNIDIKLITYRRNQLRKFYLNHWRDATKIESTALAD